MAPENELLMVFTTAEDAETLIELSRAAVEAKLAACGQVDGPLTSLYRWEGEVQQAQEYRCLLKTTRAQYSSLEAFIRQRHPYDQPQIVGVEIETAEPGYARWVADSCR